MAFPTTNLYVRYEAESEVAYTDGNTVTTANDQGPNGIDLTVASTNKPTWKESSINGLAAYRHNAGASVGIYSTLGTITPSAFTISAVVELDSALTARGNVFGVFDEFVDQFSINAGGTSGEWGARLRLSSGTLVDLVTSGATTTNPAVLTLTWDGTTARFYVNGTEVDNGLLNNAATLNVDEIVIGSNATAGAGEPLGGDVSLAAAWTTALDATARADLHTYVQDTYGITVSDTTYYGYAVVEDAATNVSSVLSLGSVTTTALAVRGFRLDFN